MRTSVFLFLTVLLIQACGAQTDPEPITPSKVYPEGMSTHLYAVKKGDSLELDLYRPESTELLPTVIFVHGGGFYAGKRQEKNIEHFCDSLRDCGFAVANISYHLYLKGQSFHCDQPADNKVNAFASAAEDLKNATRFLIDHSDSLGIDTTSIYIAGSSAGAETVLHAAYWPYDYRIPKGASLDKDFRYKGVIAFAGAMVDDMLIQPENVVPTLLYHGTCDPLVPYVEAAHHYCPGNTVGALHLHGSKSIYDRISSIGGTTQLVSVCGAQHSIASKPIEQDIAQIVQFLRRVEAGESFQEMEVRRQGTDCKLGDFPECRENLELRIQNGKLKMKN